MQGRLFRVPLHGVRPQRADLRHQPGRGASHSPKP